MLQDLCEEQHDAIQEWLDTLRGQTSDATTALPPEREGMLARARDVVEHIQRVLTHVRRLEAYAAALDGGDRASLATALQRNVHPEAGEGGPCLLYTSRCV